MEVSTTAAVPDVTPAARLARCLDCATPLLGRAECSGCGRPYPVRDAILEAIGELSGRNRVVAAFYDGPGWARFRKWERLFLALQGGARRARMAILRHVVAVAPPAARVLEVGINDGENLLFLPPGWEVYGVDIARVGLLACQARFPRMRGRLALAEAERLPFPDATFDACYSVGGFTFFGDHAAALAEMRRVTRPGGPVVVADEHPGLQRAGLGHLLGVPRFDAWWLRRLGLDRAFVDMVLALDVDVPAVVRGAWPGAAILPIWNRLGYCVVDPAPDAPEPANARTR